MSRLKPRRSHQRRYMRSSISAQSWLSVPPAPALIVRIALARSCSPPSIFWNSASSTLASRASRAAAKSLATSSPAASQSARTWASSSWPLSRFSSSRSASSALAALQQLLGGLLVVPEAGVGHLRLERVELGAELAFLKDSRGCPRPSLAATSSRCLRSALKIVSFRCLILVPRRRRQRRRQRAAQGEPRRAGARRRRRRGACRRSSRPRTGTSRTSTVARTARVGSSTRPRGSTTAVIPVFAARTR